ncbi:conjugal transfer protein [Streptomyces cyaneochromogenes]|uniref:Conjugal transfer protein n=1 Tax=Streptomyces cyaneochromogenes TaxID=2496836 RepID=A0A3Q9F0Q3_9ACTN|nr:conjugal transfer protein [Streptomyces cyaneochromogenes]AZQ39976.1 conjugal transfer protein [Streptomyces cyaneochromogenes]
MLRAKQASTSQATAPVAAGVALRGMRRRVRLSRLAVWSVIAAGPAALGVAVASSPTGVEAAAVAKPATVRSAAASADPGGYAQLFVSVWLRSSADDAESAQARLAQSMAPNVELPEAAAGAQAPQGVIAVRSARRAGGTWSVTVAAQYADATVRYYAVPVVAGRTGGSFAVMAAPAVVAGPGRAEVPASPYRVRVAGGELASTVEEFLAAYLTGAGEVGRYLGPGTVLPALSPAPFARVTVRQVLAVEESSGDGRVPADNTTVRVLAQVEARDEGGRWPLGYELCLTARSGRWDIAALTSGTSDAQGVR